MYLMTDSLGYVWCQHPNSLSRFDGYSFKVFQYDEHDPKRNALNFNIVGMIRDATGNIWAGQQQISNKPPFRLVKYDWKLDKFEKYDINAPGGFNAPQFEKDNSAMWAHSTRGGALSISILNLVS